MTRRATSSCSPHVCRRPRVDVCDARVSRERIYPALCIARRADAPPSVGRESYAIRCHTARADRSHGKMLVMFLHDFLVRLTVTAFSVGKIRTACHAAWSLRLSRHHCSPSKKPSRRISSPRRLTSFLFLLSISYHCQGSDIKTTSTVI